MEKRAEKKFKTSLGATSEVTGSPGVSIGSHKAAEGIGREAEMKFKTSSGALKKIPEHFGITAGKD
jgi:hypothetical protein